MASSICFGRAPCLSNRKAAISIWTGRKGKAVDRLYRAAPFETDRDRVEHLFGRYEALVNPLERLGAAKNKRVSRKAKAKADSV